MAKPRQAGSVMPSSSSTHSVRCERTAAGPSTGVNLDGQRKKHGRGADRRHHQGLPNQIEPGDIFSGFRRRDQIGNHEAVGNAGDGQQSERQRQRQALFRCAQKR